LSSKTGPLSTKKALSTEIVKESQFFNSLSERKISVDSGSAEILGSAESNHHKLIINPVGIDFLI
jgi:hypothetical protein